VMSSHGSRPEKAIASIAYAHHENSHVSDVVPSKDSMTMCLSSE
jgi:hypothetical protein